MKFQVCVSVLVLALASASGKNFPQQSRASCPPKPDTISEFDQARYLGDWYQVQGIPTFFSPSDSTCIRATYGQNDDGTVSVHNVLNYPDGSFGEICGFAYSPDSENPGDLIVEFPQSPKGDYWILGTDYENWASVYACEDIIGIKFEYGWVLTRDPNPAQEYVDASFAAFTNGGVGLEAFEVNPQGNCTYEDTTVVSCADQ